MTDHNDEIQRLLKEYNRSNEMVLRLTNPYRGVKAMEGGLNLGSMVNKEMKGIASIVTKSDLTKLQQAFKVPVNPEIVEAVKMFRVPRVPVFEFPKFDLKLPKINIDYEQIEKITKHNSKYGWTLTGEMAINLYLDDKLLECDQKEMDEIFESYYSLEDSKLYEYLKKSLTENIDNKWSSALEEIFYNYEQNRFKVIIPILISIIEGEISRISKSDAYGSRLITEYKKSISNEEKIATIAAYSLHNFLDLGLFAYNSFHKDRKPMINRNWVLHGRDNPELWEKVDALRLMNVLSTMYFI